MDNINNMDKKVHMKGGTFKLGNLLKTKLSIADIIRKTKKSELKLISCYKDMYKKTKQYELAYDDHLKNINILDEKINFNGMETIFKKVIMKDIMKDGRVDRSEPLLFINYLIRGEISPPEYIKEHILRQVEYNLYKYFASRDHIYIKNIEISNITKEDFQCTILTRDDVEKKYKINHSNYLIDKSETKAMLHKILSDTKKNLKRDSAIELLKNTNKSIKDNKSRKDNKTKKSRETFTLSILNTKSKNKSKSKHNNSKSKSNLSMINLDFNTKSKNKPKSISRSKTINKSVKSIKDIKNEIQFKPLQRKKLSLFMTKSEKKAEADAAAKLLQPIGIPQQQVQFGSPIPTVDTKALQLLTQGAPTIGQPLQQTPIQGQVQSTDPEDIRCNAGNDFESCKSLGGCHWKLGKCNKNIPLQQTSFTPAVNPFALPS